MEMSQLGLNAVSVHALNALASAFGLREIGLNYAVPYYNPFLSLNHTNCTF